MAPRVCPAGYYGLCGGDREAANEADKCGGEEQRPTGQQMLERRWGAALDSRWTVRIDSEEGEDSVGYRACASSRPPGFEVTWRESDCTMSSPSLGPAQPCSTQPLRLGPGSWLRNRVRTLLCIFGFFASRRRDLLATAKTGPSYMQLSAWLRAVTTFPHSRFTLLPLARQHVGIRTHTPTCQ